MHVVKEYLESSSIHGLYFINSSKHQLVKFFWICIVITGFCGALVMIDRSVISWNTNQVSTTIETMPIEKVTIPLITVCPPKVTTIMIATKDTKKA